MNRRLIYKTSMSMKYVKEKKAVRSLPSLARGYGLEGEMLWAVVTRNVKDRPAEIPERAAGLPQEAGRVCDWTWGAARFLAAWSSAWKTFNAS